MASSTPTDKLVAPLVTNLAGDKYHLISNTRFMNLWNTVQQKGPLSKSNQIRYIKLTIVTVRSGPKQLCGTKKVRGKQGQTFQAQLCCFANVWFIVYELYVTFKGDTAIPVKDRASFVLFLNRYTFHLNSDYFLHKTGLWPMFEEANEAMFASLLAFGKNPEAFLAKKIVDPKQQRTIQVNDGAVFVEKGSSPTIILKQFTGKDAVDNSKYYADGATDNTKTTYKYYKKHKNKPLEDDSSDDEDVNENTKGVDDDNLFYLSSSSSSHSDDGKENPGTLNDSTNKIGNKKGDVAMFICCAGALCRHHGGSLQIELKNGQKKPTHSCIFCQGHVHGIQCSTYADNNSDAEGGMICLKCFHSKQPTKKGARRATGQPTNKGAPISTLKSDTASKKARRATGQPTNKGAPISTLKSDTASITARRATGQPTNKGVPNSTPTNSTPSKLNAASITARATVLGSEKNGTNLKETESSPVVPKSSRRETESTHVTKKPAAKVVVVRITKDGTSYPFLALRDNEFIPKQIAVSYQHLFLLNSEGLGQVFSITDKSPPLTLPDEPIKMITTFQGNSFVLTSTGLVYMLLDDRIVQIMDWPQLESVLAGASFLIFTDVDGDPWVGECGHVTQLFSKDCSRQILQIACTAKAAVLLTASEGNVDVFVVNDFTLLRDGKPFDSIFSKVPGLPLLSESARLKIVGGGNHAVLLADSTLYTIRFLSGTESGSGTLQVSCEGHKFQDIYTGDDFAVGVGEEGGSLFTLPSFDSNPINVDLDSTFGGSRYHIRGIEFGPPGTGAFALALHDSTGEED